MKKRKNYKYKLYEKEEKQMKTKTPPSLNHVLITALLFALASISFAAEPAADKPTSKEVQQKVADSVDAIEKYSVDQRDEAIKSAQAAMDDLDARIDQMESKISRKWDQMDQAARKEMTTTLNSLRKQRNEVAEWYGGMKHSAGNKWEDIKKGFVNSYHELRRTFDKVRSEY
jgi:TolA-binding protein